MRKSWREKLANDKNLPTVAKVTGKMTKRWGTGTMVKRTLVADHERKLFGNFR